MWPTKNTFKHIYAMPNSIWREVHIRWRCSLQCRVPHSNVDSPLVWLWNIRQALVEPNYPFLTHNIHQIQNDIKLGTEKKLDCWTILPWLSQDKYELLNYTFSDFSLIYTSVFNQHCSHGVTPSPKWNYALGWNRPKQLWLVYFGSSV